jgi:hypothetical protein
LVTLNSGILLVVFIHRGLRSHKAQLGESGFESYLRGLAACVVLYVVERGLLVSGKAALEVKSQVVV